jgi:magnesium chelatase family protein
MEWYGFAVSGYEGTVVSIEVDIRRGIPGMDIVGLPGSAVREARDRMRVAVRNSGLEFPRDRILVNLAPADVPKIGTAYDLSIALAVLDADRQIIPEDSSKKVLVLGELLLSGAVRPVSGVLPAVLAGLKKSLSIFLVPEENYSEGCAVGKGDVYGISSLTEAVHILSLLVGGKTIPRPVPIVQKSKSTYPDYGDIVGKELLKRAMEVSVAGRHSLLLFGPPGSGKTMAAMRIPSILPPLCREEALETTRIHSLAGILPAGGGLVEERPFRAPHHGASLEGVLGGGRFPAPGEISLAHNGTLFLDEASEFSRRILQGLREPLEEGSVTLVRAGRRERFPADFHLVLATNPCPCGNLGKEKGVCLCSDEEIYRYWRRLGGALMDRIDMRIPVHPAGDAEFSFTGERRTSRDMSLAVREATEIQHHRYEETGVRFNSRLSYLNALKVCRIDSEIETVFLETGKMLGLSSRGLVSVLRIARTVADLERKKKIEKEHLFEAFQYRRYGDADLFWHID